MTIINSAVPFDAPSENHYREFTGYMDPLKDGKVWVHCIVNSRVSGSFLLSAKARGFSARKVASPLLMAWMPEIDEVWKEFINRAAAQPAKHALDIVSARER